MKLCIGDLAAVIGGELTLASLPPLAGAYEPVRRIVVESREARTGDVFWGLTAPGVDGSLWAEEAFLRGAFGVVVNGRHVEPWAGRFTIRVPDCNHAFQQLLEHLPRRPSRQQPALSRRCSSTQLVQALLAGRRVAFERILEKLAENAARFVA